MRVLDVVSDPGRHRPHPPRRPRPACASSSRPAPVAPLTARPFGDVFTLSRPAAVLAAPLGPRTGHFVMRALPLAPWTVPEFPDRALPAARRAAPYSPPHPNSRFEPLKRPRPDRRRWAIDVAALWSFWTPPCALDTMSLHGLQG